MINFHSRFCGYKRIWKLFFSVLISRTLNRKLYLTFSIALTMIFAFSVTVPLYKSLHPCLSKANELSE